MKSSGPTARARRRGRGFTLVEVLLALAISAMIAGAVGSLLFAVGNGTRDNQDLRRRNVKADVLGSRVDAAIRSSTVLLGRDENALVLWVADTREDEKANLSELRRIEWDAPTKEIRVYQAAAGLPAASDTAYDLTTNFLALTAALRDTASFPGETWGRNVSGWSTGPAITSQSTRLLSHTLTIRHQGGQTTFHTTSSLRGRLKPAP